MEGDTDLYGKDASVFGDFKFAKSGMVSGTANYVTGYTGFNATDVNEQEGYYLPIAFTASQDVKEAYMQVVGSKNGPVKMDPANVIFLGKTVSTAKKKQISITSGDLQMILSLTNVKFNAKA